MDGQRCLECGGNLTLGAITRHKKRCQACTYQRRVAFVLSDEYVHNAFVNIWVRELYKRLGTFLKQHQVPIETQARMLSKASVIFQEADQCFKLRVEMDEEWLEERIEKAGHKLTPTFFKKFLVEEKIISDRSKAERNIEAIQSKIERIPQNYRRLIEIYFNDRIALRESQMKHNAKRPLAVETMESDWELLSRLVRWLTEHEPDLAGWLMVQEEHIHAFLLTLTPKLRELARKDLFAFFRLARKKRIISHVPIIDFPAKELPLTVDPLNVEEQKVLTRLIQENIYTSPEEAFLTVLCFYHGLSSSQICHLKMGHINIEQGIISLEGRPPVYVLEQDLILLEQFLRMRKDLPYAQRRSHLFISNQTRVDDEPLGSEYVCRKVRAFSGYTCRILRITCFTTLSAQYGPQYLIEAFGLSLTQASRYGNVEAFLLEEEVKQQREEYLEMLRHL